MRGGTWVGGMCHDDTDRAPDARRLGCLGFADGPCIQRRRLDWPAVPLLDDRPGKRFEPYHDGSGARGRLPAAQPSVSASTVATDVMDRWIGHG